MTRFKYQTPEDFIEAYRQGLEDAESMEMFKTIEMIEKMAGSFVKSLAEAWYHADPINKRKLIGAFPEYFSKYYSMIEEKTK